MHAGSLSWQGFGEQYHPSQISTPFAITATVIAELTDSERARSLLGLSELTGLWATADGITASSTGPTPPLYHIRSVAAGY